MAVDRFGNTICDVCRIKIFNGLPFANRQIGKDGYALCSQGCLDEFEIVHAGIEGKFTAALADEEERRKGADEQKGWKLHRWWNQTYKRKKDVLEAKRIEREFKAIQRKARRKG